MTAPTLGAVLADLKSRFSAAGLPEPAADARTLIGELLSLHPTVFLTDPGRAITPDEHRIIEVAAMRRLAREPVFRILGYREFYGLELALSAETLEPRPDTEVLVDRVLPYLQRIVALGREPKIIDFGTGTGAIALALLSQCPSATAVGVDISADALRTAAANAERLGLGSRFTALQSNWTEAVSGLFDIVVSNPPYIVHQVMAELSPEVRLHDPVAALDGGADGLDAYRALAASIPDCLGDNGIVALEIGYDQRESVTRLFELAGFHLLEAVKDFGGQDRVLVFDRPQN